MRGAVFGLLLWVLSQGLVTPMMGGGFFSAKAGGMTAVMASLMAHVIYGGLLGALGGHAVLPVRQYGIPRPRQLV